jgi:carbon storage regulator
VLLSGTQEGAPLLILTRKPGESIHVGDDIKITVIDLEGKRVKLGVDAPRHIAVDRAEIAERKRAGLPPPQSE